jgi:MFS family permease
LEDNLHVRPFCGSRLSSGMFLAFLFGAFGAIVAELLKRWQQWNDMPKKRFLALSKSIELWAITVFLILLGGSVGVFESTKTHPIDWSLCFFVGVGAISTVRNFSPGWRRMGVRARNDDGLRGSLAAAEYPTVV